MSEAHRPVEHFLQRRGLSEKGIIEMQNLVDTQLIHQLHVFDHLVQRREPSPVGSSLTDAVCRLVAHQDPGSGRIPWIHKLVTQTSSSKNVKLYPHRSNHTTTPRWLDSCILPNASQAGGKQPPGLNSTVTCPFKESFWLNMTFMQTQLFSYETLDKIARYF